MLTHELGSSSTARSNWEFRKRVIALVIARNPELARRLNILTVDELLVVEMHNPVLIDEIWQAYLTVKLTL
jgi:hypothetical protein